MPEMREETRKRARDRSSVRSFEWLESEEMRDTRARSLTRATLYKCKNKIVPVLPLALKQEEAEVRREMREDKPKYIVNERYTRIYAHEREETYTHLYIYREREKGRERQSVCV